MTKADLLALLPLMVLGAASVAVLLGIAVRRSHLATAALAGAGLLLTLASLPLAASAVPRQVTPLLVVDGYALFFTALLCGASLVVVVLAYGYFARRGGQREELYLLLLLATLGSVVLAGSTHFASLFLGLELLSVSLYALIAYTRERRGALEAGVKYLILAAASSAFLLFGMALVYGVGGSLALAELVGLLEPEAGGDPLLLAGLGLMVAGVGFKLGLVPFHLWTPDVYAGAPAPVTAFVASVSKGGMVALVLRLFVGVETPGRAPLLVLGLIAIASMLAGNLLALLQDNLKRLLAYSSIAHLGYLMVAVLASGELATEAASYYLVAYFVTTLAAFGVVTVVSSPQSSVPPGDGEEAEELADYRGLFWRRPGLAALLTAALLSLAGIPLTAGFVGKFYVLAAGVDASRWLLVLTLVAGSAIGLFYYLRVVVAMFTADERQPSAEPARTPWLANAVLAGLGLSLLWLGIYPAPLVRIIQALVVGSP